MSIFSSDYRPMRRSLSLPDLIASRHDSSVSGGTVSTGITMAGSCSILDKLSLNELYHNHHPCDHHHYNHHHHQLIYQQHPHYSKDHKKPDNVSKSYSLLSFFSFTFLSSFFCDANAHKFT